MRGRLFSIFCGSKVHITQNALDLAQPGERADAPRLSILGAWYVAPGSAADAGGSGAGGIADYDHFLRGATGGGTGGTGGDGHFLRGGAGPTARGEAQRGLVAGAKRRTMTAAVQNEVDQSGELHLSFASDHMPTEDPAQRDDVPDVQRLSLEPHERHGSSFVIDYEHDDSTATSHRLRLDLGHRAAKGEALKIEVHIAPNYAVAWGERASGRAIDMD